MRLFQPGVVDHCITVDANRERILDSIEIFPIICSAESLKLCRDDKAKNLHV